MNDDDTSRDRLQMARNLCEYEPCAYMWTMMDGELVTKCLDFKARCPIQINSMLYHVHWLLVTFPAEKIIASAAFAKSSKFGHWMTYVRNKFL